MCHALISVKHRVGEASLIRCETSDELADRIAKLKANDETLEFRVFTSAQKFVRTTTWEEVK